jgi:hypothetical protein
LMSGISSQSSASTATALSGIFRCLFPSRTKKGSEYWRSVQATEPQYTGVDFDRRSFGCHPQTFRCDGPSRQLPERECGAS